MFLGYLRQRGPSLVLVVLVIVTSLLTVHPVSALIRPRYHAPIVIDGNGDFTQQNGVTGGNGTANNPYTIEGWEIDTNLADGIAIRNTDANVIIQNIYIHPFPSTPYPLGSTYYFGLLLENTSNIRLLNSTLVRNQAGILPCNTDNIIITGSNISHNYVGIDSLQAGCSPGFNNHFVIDGNRLTENVDGGIRLSYTAHDQIFNNIISSNGERNAYLYQSTDIDLSRNQFISSTEGLEFYGTNDVMVSNNTFSKNGGNGLSAYNASNVAVTSNVFTENGHGFAYGGAAIDLRLATKAVLSDNTIASNRYGLRLGGATETLVFHNNLLNNTVQAFDNRPITDDWDAGYPSGGNFWSDYVGVDNCSGPLQNICLSPDGIGDTHYAFNLNDDRYPLMKPFAPQMFAAGKYNLGFLNLNSPSRYLTVSIQLPLGLNVSDVVLSSIRLNSTITLAAGARATVVSPNHPQVLIVKFNIAEVKTLFTKAGHYSLNLTGNIVDSVAFRSFAAITLIRVQSR